MKWLMRVVILGLFALFFFFGDLILNWVMQVIIFGLFALFFFFDSIICAIRMDFSHGLLCGLLELASAAISSSAFAWALKVSGKADWYLLGIHRYTPYSLIFWSMFAVGVLCLAVNGVGLVRKWTTARA